MFGAQLAAALGLPFAFASHFAPGQMMQAIEVYRAQFRPSERLEQPYVMLGFNVFAADTDEEARAAVHVAAAGVRQPAARPAGTAAAAVGRFRGSAGAGGARHDRAGAVELRRRLTRDGTARDAVLHRPHRRGRVDRHVADLRPRRAAASPTRSPRLFAMRSTPESLPETRHAAIVSTKTATELTKTRRDFSTTESRAPRTGAHAADPHASHAAAGGGPLTTIARDERPVRSRGFSSPAIAVSGRSAGAAGRCATRSDSVPRCLRGFVRTGARAQPRPLNPTASRAPYLSALASNLE